MLTVRRDGDLAAWHDVGPDSFTCATQCSRGAWWPSLGQLQRAYAVYAAYEGDALVAVCPVTDQGRVLYLNGYPDRIAAGCAAIVAQVYADLGAAWGTVNNDQVRADVLAAGDGHIVNDDGHRLVWVP